LLSQQRLGMRIGASQKQLLKQRLQSVSPSQWTEFLENLPKDMLFAMRVNDMVRSINKVREVQK